MANAGTCLRWCTLGDFISHSLKMEDTGVSCESSENHNNLKRKRVDSDDNVEGLSPYKKFAKLKEELSDQPAHIVVVESEKASSATSEEHESGLQPYQTIEFIAEYTLGPPSISDVTSPVENVVRADSPPNSSNKRPSSSVSAEEIPPKRKCPLPWLACGKPADVWECMCESDAKNSSRKDPNMFDAHPTMQPRMRAILLDWLNEVSEVYKLHRETYHLSIDYLDRYISKTSGLHKSRLQLLGITCLFIAAKVEEVYPPKASEFAYVTDGACAVEDIMLEELMVMKVLSWASTPITVDGWLNVYMQLSSEGRNAARRLLSESDVGASALRGYTFLFPQYSSLDFVMCGQLVDLALMDVGVNRFRNSEVAAAAVAHTFTAELAVRVSGYAWAALRPCYLWMMPFVNLLRKEGPVTVVRGGDGEFVQNAAALRHICPDINQDESHRIQSHNVTLSMYDRLVASLEENSSDPEETQCAFNSYIDARAQ